MSLMEERIKGVYDTLPQKEKKVAEYCLNNQDDIFKYSISELAKRSETSQVAWVRFSKSLGYTGMKELKTKFYNEVRASLDDADRGGPKIEFKDLDQYTSLQAIADNICATSLQAVQTTYRLFDTPTFNEVVEKIIEAKHIQIFGIGASAIAAYDLYCKFQRINYHVIYNEDSHNSRMTASQLCDEDVAIFFCDSGHSRGILELLDLAKEKKATTVGITKLGNNPLSKGSDYVLFTTSPEIDRKSGVTSSRFAQLYLVDTLYTAVANRDYKNVKKYLQSSFEAFHNGVE
ncbi:MAG: MurR/RpiR family transcriptional regulator [Butyrivibrio sp.]|nr:MurR/RpiR family transcriptional regulator [Butyrivibrio sp.]